jgi:hypothetical protein
VAQAVQVQVLLSAPTFVRMKNVFLLLLAAVLLAGCVHRYDITLVNGMKMTHVSKPKLDNDTGMYTFTDIRGKKKTISASRVVEIAPHSEMKSKSGPPQ